MLGAHIVGAHIKSAAQLPGAHVWEIAPFLSDTFFTRGLAREAGATIEELRPRRWRGGLPGPAGM